MNQRSSIYESSPAPPGNFFDERPHLAYLLPMLAFGLVMLPGGMFGHLGGIDWGKLWHTYHPLLYTVKTVLAAGLLWWFWRYYTPIRWNSLGLGVLIGLLGMPQWILTEYAAQRIGISAPPMGAEIYNPYLEIPDPFWRAVYLVIRVAGPTLVVPVMEELFCRDFLMRALIAGGRYDEVKIGTFTWLSFLGTAAVFTSYHVQRPSAFVWALLLGWLVVKTKSIGACIVAHGVTNLTLYLWVIWRGEWQFM